MEVRLAEIEKLFAAGAISVEERSVARHAALTGSREAPTTVTAAASTFHFGDGFTSSSAAPGATTAAAAALPNLFTFNGDLSGDVYESSHSCPLGHTMTLVNNDEGALPAGDGLFTVSTKCSSCMVKLKKREGEQYFICISCDGVKYCPRCVREQRHLPSNSQWSTGLCGCAADWRTCIDAFTFPWCFQALLCDRMTSGFDSDPGGEVIPAKEGCEGASVSKGCCFFFFDFSMLFLVNFYSWPARQAMLTAAGIEEDLCTTCLIVFLCRTCSDLQVHREMTRRGMFPGGFCCSRRPVDTMGVSVPGIPMMSAGGGKSVTTTGSPAMSAHEAPMITRRNDRGFFFR